MFSKLLTALRITKASSGAAFRAELRRQYKDHKVVSYAATRIIMYNQADCENNKLYLIYGGEPYDWKCGQNKNPPVADINAEHTVPQSFFSKNQPMVTDLHHLISAPHAANELRSNYKFNEFPYSKCAKFCKGCGSLAEREIHCDIAVFNKILRARAYVARGGYFAAALGGGIAYGAAHSAV